MMMTTESFPIFRKIDQGGSTADDEVSERVHLRAAMHRLAAGSQLALRGRLPRQALREAPLPLKPTASFPEPVSVTHRFSWEQQRRTKEKKSELFPNYLRPPRGPLDAAHYLLHAWIGREVPPEELPHSPPGLRDRRLVMDRSPRLFCKKRRKTP
jgi:hypothetical protein